MFRCPPACVLFIFFRKLYQINTPQNFTSNSRQSHSSFLEFILASFFVWCCPVAILRYRPVPGARPSVFCPCAAKVVRSARRTTEGCPFGQTDNLRSEAPKKPEPEKPVQASQPKYIRALLTSSLPTANMMHTPK